MPRTAAWERPEDCFSRSRGRRRSHSLGFESDHSLNRYSRANESADDYFAHAANDGKRVTVTVYLASDYDSKRLDDAFHHVRSSSAGSAYDAKRNDGYDTDHHQYMRGGRQIRPTKSRSVSPSSDRQRLSGSYKNAGFSGNRGDQDRYYDRYTPDRYFRRRDSFTDSERQAGSRSRSLGKRPNMDSFDYYGRHPSANREIRSRSAYPIDCSRYADHPRRGQDTYNNNRDVHAGRQQRNASASRFDGRLAARGHDSDHRDFPARFSNRMNYSGNFDRGHLERGNFSQPRRNEQDLTSTRHGQYSRDMSRTRHGRFDQGGRGLGFHPNRYSRDVSRNRFVAPPNEFRHRDPRMFHESGHMEY